MMGARREGRIYKVTGGFYYVRGMDGTDLCCRARGLFRKQKISPVAGDLVQVEPTVPGEGYVVEILPRKNFLVRPPLANLDQFVLVVSMTDPVPNYYVLDKMLSIAIHQGMKPILAVTKTDLEDEEPLLEHYRNTGFPIVAVSPDGEEGVRRLSELLKEGVSAFCGNTGAGKSTLLNRLDTGLCLETGETSKKLGRGRHTTRHVELFPFESGFIADTPGFSAVDMERYGEIPKEALADCFPEFLPFAGKCRFADCAHTVEVGCAVLEGLSAGEISGGRHDNYKELYAQAKLKPSWKTT